MKIVKINNPFQRYLRDVEERECKNEVLGDVLRGHLRDVQTKHGLSISWDEAKESIQLSVNGLVIPPEFWDSQKLRPDDCIVVMPIVSKDSSSKQILSMVIMLAAMFVVGPTAPLITHAFGEGTVAAFVVGVGAIIGTGLLLSALTPAPKMRTPDDYGNSQIYGWSPHSTQQQGIVIPKFYGTNKLYGNIVAVHSQPDDEDDTKEIIQMLVALGAGPVEGIVAGTIQINDQPATNYSEVTTEEKRGTMNQTVVSFFTETKPEFRPNRVVSNTDGAVIYTTSDNDFDDLEIELIFARGLYYADNSGGLSNNSVGIKVEISVSGAESYNTLVATTITDNTTSPKRMVYITGKSYTGGSSPTVSRGNKYDVRVTKTTADATSSRYADELRLGAVREVLNDDFVYPGIALLGIEALATDQISGSINLSCIQKGAIVNVYDGVEWNLEWSDNPAWVLWDILTRPVISGDGSTSNPYTISRYDGVNPNRLDIVKFYELAQFCDEDDIPDGEGGFEKRARFNGGFDMGITVWEAASRVCEVARCAIVLQGTTYTLAIDKTDTPVLCFNVANIIADSFEKTYLPQSELISEIEVQYRDEDQDYERVPFTVINPNITTGIKSTIELFGITKQSEAWRAVMFRLAQNEYLKTTIRFDVDIDSIACTVGDVIHVQHDVPQWGIGGRIVSGTSGYFIADRDLNYESDKTYAVLVQKSADDALNERVVSSCYNSITDINTALNEITISGNYEDEYKDGDSIRISDSTGNDGDYTIDGDAVGSTGSTIITIDGILPSAVADGGVFNLRRVIVTAVFKDANEVESAVSKDDKFNFGVLDTELRKFRVIKLSRTGEQVCTVTAIDYDERIYAVDGDSPIIPITDYTSPPSASQLITPPTRQDLWSYYPPTMIEDGLTVDIPLTTNLQWNNDTPSAGYISWSKEDGVNPILVRYKGTTYEVAVGNTNKTYVYWDVSSPTTLQTTDVLATAIGTGKWVMGYNDDGDAYPAFGQKIIHGGLIQAGTLVVTQADIEDLDVEWAQIQNVAIVSADIGNLEVKTANIANLNVTTGKIADEATCVYNTAQTSGATGWFSGWGGTPTEIQSITETSLGGVINIFYSFTVHNYDASNHYIYYKLYRGSTELTGWIASGTIVAGTDLIIGGSFVDVPGSGSKTYYVKALDQSTGNPEDHKATYRNMVFSEPKGK